MIISIVVTVECNQCGEEAVFDMTALSGACRELRKFLDAEGWKADSDGTHLCAECLQGNEGLGLLDEGEE